jgi:hypothetical protein
MLGVGMLFVMGGLLLMATTHPNSTWTVLLPGFLVAGFGVGIVNPVLASGAVSVVQPQRSGMASGANNTFRQVGIATGIAVLGAVFQSQIVAHTNAALAKSPYGPEVLRQGGAQLRGAMASGEVRAAAAAIPVAGARNALLQAYHSAFSVTLNHLMVIGAVVSLVGAVCGFALVRQRDFVIPGVAPGGHPAQGGQGQPGGEAASDDTVPAVHA